MMTFRVRLNGPVTSNDDDSWTNQQTGEIVARRVLRVFDSAGGEVVPVTYRESERPGLALVGPGDTVELLVELQAQSRKNGAILIARALDVIAHHGAGNGKSREPAGASA